MENNKIAISVEQQFGEVIDIILRHKSRASKGSRPGSSGICYEPEYEPDNDS